MRRSFLDSILSIAIGVALFFISEVSLRILYPEKVLEIAEERRTIQSLAYEHHPEYLIALKPNITKTFKRDDVNGGDEIRWKTNSSSYRGRELAPHPKVRVVVYGDSNVQARFSHLEHTFPYRLEVYLEKLTETDVEVINAGVVGYGPDQSLLRFSQEVDTLNPDIVVFHLFADNDFGDPLRNRLYELDSNGVLRKTDQKRTVDERLKPKYPRLVAVKAARKVLRLFKNVNRSSAPETTARRAGNGLDDVNLRVVKKHLASSEEEYVIYKNRESRTFSHFADHYDMDIALDPEGESSKTKIALMDAVLDKAKTLAVEKGVGFLVVIQPASLDLTRNVELNYQYLSQYPEYRPDRLTSLMAEICARHNLHHINLFPVFMENNPGSLFFKGEDDHWNDTGQDVAARETASFIYENFLLQRAAQ